MLRADAFTLFRTKKAGLHYCCSAHWGSGIAFRYKQQHRSPRRMYSDKHARSACKTLHTMSILVSRCFVTTKFTRFQWAKTLRYKDAKSNYVRTPPRFI